MLNNKPNGTYSLKARKDQGDQIDPCLTDDLLEADMATLLTACVAKIAAAHPEAAEVSIARTPNTTVLDYRLADPDKGPFIGRHGQVIHALQVLARAMLGEKMLNHTVIVNLTKDGRDNRTYNNGRERDYYED